MIGGSWGKGLVGWLRKIKKMRGLDFGLMVWSVVIRGCKGGCCKWIVFRGQFIDI